MARINNFSMFTNYFHLLARSEKNYKHVCIMQGKNGFSIVFIITYPGKKWYAGFEINGTHLCFGKWHSPLFW